MPSLTVAMVLVVLLILIFPYNNVYGDEQQDSCSTRCGVHNISHPFWLKNSPKKCRDKRYMFFFIKRQWDERYMLSCENNNQLILYYEVIKYLFKESEFRKYYVQSINYNNFTIRLLDFSLGYSNYSRPPYYSFGVYNVSADFLSTPYQFYQYKNHSKNILTKSLLHVSCPNQAAGYMYSGNCMNSTSYSQYRNSFYVEGYKKSLSDLRLRDACHIEFVYLTSWNVDDDNNNNNNVSCMDIRHMIHYGFELSWLNGVCKEGWYVKLDSNNDRRCVYEGNYLLVIFGGIIYVGCLYIFKCLPGVPFIIALLIYMWHRKHLSMYDEIEGFLRSENSIMPIRYSYKDIRKITQQFKIKLGNGGYGSVFKGQLQSGRLVAVKLLDNVKSSGQDFVNEIVTVGRIHHVNVVQLIGFCVEGSKRALIYEFMSNGSLEKYIFSPVEESCSLSCKDLYAISLGVAGGIEYLHNGCNMKILHFDIKPHNILLDENFNPKVSDFGLARLSPTDKSIVSLTAIRGTIGYMAPELFYRNIGTISQKADVYSFGMLLMEMASRRKNLNALAEQSSQVYFPFWIYDQLHDGREVTIENDTNLEMKLAKKMMIVALWCIQTKPEDRPSMDKVLEMLEEEDGELQIPNKPYFCLQDEPVSEVGHDNINSSWTS